MKQSLNISSKVRPGAGPLWLIAILLVTPGLAHALSIRHTFALSNSAIGSAALIQNRNNLGWLALSIRGDSRMYFDVDSETGAISSLYLLLETYTHQATQNADGSFTIGSLLQDYGSLTADFSTTSTHDTGFFAAGTPGTVSQAAGNGQLVSYGNGFGGIPLGGSESGLEFSSLSDANGIYYSMNMPLFENQWLVSAGNMLLGEFGSFIGWTLLDDGRNMDFNFNLRYQGSTQVPEPGSLLLLASGVSAVCMRRKRKALSAQC